MKLRCLALSAVVAAFCCSVSALADTTLYSQPTCDCGAWNSQASSGENGTAYDDFTLGTAAHIDNVKWFGVPTAIPDGITAFTIDLYANNAGQPGTLIASDVVSGNAGQTDSGAAGPYGEEYTYNANVSFDVAANTTYWISMVATMPYPPQFGVALGNGGDLVDYENFQGTLTQHGSDLAFTLTGTPTPEPSGLVLAGTGLAAVGGALRRRLRRA